MNVVLDLMEQDLDGISQALELIRESPQDGALVARQAKVADQLLRRVFVRANNLKKARLAAE